MLLMPRRARCSPQGFVCFGSCLFLRLATAGLIHFCQNPKLSSFRSGMRSSISSETRRTWTGLWIGCWTITECALSPMLLYFTPVPFGIKPGLVNNRLPHRAAGFPLFNLLTRVFHPCPGITSFLKPPQQPLISCSHVHAVDLEKKATCKESLHAFIHASFFLPLSPQLQPLQTHSITPSLYNVLRSICLVTLPHPHPHPVLSTLQSSAIWSPLPLLPPHVLFSGSFLLACRRLRACGVCL